MSLLVVLCIGSLWLINTADAIVKRKNVDDLTDGELLFLRLGFQKMRLLPKTDSSSAIYQANMHGHAMNLSHPVLDEDNPCTDEDIATGTCSQFGVPITATCFPVHTEEFAAAYPQNMAWSQAQHGSFLFLPWHRLFLRWFERILRYQAKIAINELKSSEIDDRYARTLNLVTDSVIDSTGIPYWDSSNEGDFELSRPWSLNDTFLPLLLREGVECSDGLNGQPASSLEDVLSGSCNPLRISSEHRSPICNEGLPCVTFQYADWDYEGIRSRYMVDARPMLETSCSYTCDPDVSDTCPDHGCMPLSDWVPSTINSMHGSEVNTSLPPTAVARRAGTALGIFEEAPHSSVHFQLGNYFNKVCFFEIVCCLTSRLTNARILR